jgi:hypothetical protein
VGKSQLQHYLPRVFLKGFATPSGDVWRYDRLDGSRKLLPVSVIAAENNLYSLQEGGEVSQEIEDEWLRRPDATFGPILRRLESGGNLSREALDLSTFLAYLLVRTPGQIRETEQLLRQLHTALGPLDSTVKYHTDDDTGPGVGRGDSFLLAEEQSDIVPRTRAGARERNEALKVLMGSAMTIARALLDLKWSLLFAPRGRSFIVGDNPFAVVPPKSHPVDLEGVGPMTPGAATFVPLSSTLCLRVTTSGDIGKWRLQADGSAVRAVNNCQVINSERYLFGPDETLMIKLTESIKCHCLNPAVVVHQGSSQCLPI